MSKNNSDVKHFSGRLSNGTKKARIICICQESIKSIWPQYFQYDYVSCLIDY